MEATCFGVIVNLAWVVYSVLPSCLAGEDAGQAQSAQLLINTLHCTQKVQALLLLSCKSVLCPCIFTEQSAHD